LDPPAPWPSLDADEAEGFGVLEQANWQSQSPDDAHGAGDVEQRAQEAAQAIKADAESEEQDSGDHSGCLNPDGGEAQHTACLIPEDSEPAKDLQEERTLDATRSRITETYAAERQRVEGFAHVLEGLDVDGWGLERSQFDLVEEADEDLTELQVLLQCTERESNRERLRRAIKEFEMKLRVRRTWAWFPLTRYQWSGYEYGKPMIRLDFKLPGAGCLAADDIHCEFGTDWFDLKVWNVVWPDDPGTRYHHRVKKTRLMRDIVPSESSVKARGDHLYVYLQKVNEPRHGFCAWPELAAGKGRKPFKYREDAPDGGLMDFFEGEYEKHEGYDGFRRDIGKAMEKIHRGEPVRGIPDTPLEDD